ARRLKSAIAQSHFGDLPDEIRESLLTRATRIDVPACAYITRPGDVPRTLLVVTGLARIGTVSETGDELTLLWAHSGEWLGVAFIVEPTPRSVALPPQAFIQAVTDLAYPDIPATLLRDHARSDAAVACVIGHF